MAGVSVRRVKDITEALWGTWRMRPIEGKHPYLYLDGIVLKRSWADEVRNVSLLVAIGVNADGYREILGIVEGTKEDKADWSDAQRCASHPEASQGTGHLRYLAGHLGCLPGSGRECRRDLPPRPAGSAASCTGTAMSSAMCRAPRCARSP